MMTIISIIVCCTLASILMFLQKRAHDKEMELLAKDCSERIQEFSQKLHIIIMEPETLVAQEIISRVKLNAEMKTMLLAGNYSYKKTKNQNNV